jgi:hypothetical protein
MERAEPNFSTLKLEQWEPPSPPLRRRRRRPPGKVPSVTVAGGGGCALPRGCYPGSPRLGLPPLGLVSLRQWAMVRRRWWLRDRGGASWWVARLAEHDEVSGDGRNLCRMADTDAVTLAGATIPS